MFPLTAGVWLSPCSDPGHVLAGAGRLSHLGRRTVAGWCRENLRAKELRSSTVLVLLVWMLKVSMTLPVLTSLEEMGTFRDVGWTLSMRHGNMAIFFPVSSLGRQLATARFHFCI